MKNILFLLFGLMVVSCQQPASENGNVSSNEDKFQMYVDEKENNQRVDVFIMEKKSGKVYVRDGNSGNWFKLGNYKDAVEAQY